MAEMRVSSILILLVLVGIVGFLVLTFGGWMAVGWFRKETFDQGIAAAKGFTPAKTPTEAMDKFKDAIHARDYKSASYYCTKSYAEILKKSHDNASEQGNTIDKIQNWGKNQGLMTDKLRVTLYAFDPFPKNFKSGPAPKQDGDSKATGVYLWEPAYTLDNPAAPVLLDTKQYDARMFQNILCLKMFAIPIKLVKEGEDWKLDIPVTPAWEVEVAYFNDRCKTYQTGMNGMWKDLNNERYDTKARFEQDVIGKLAAAK